MPKKVNIFSLLLSFSCISCIHCSASPLAVSPDDLPLSEPAAQGMDPARLAEVDRRAGEIEDISSLLVIRNGSIVSEKYYQGTDQSTAFNVKSVSKSVLSALTGIAVREQYIPALDRKVLDYFPEYRDAALGAGKNEINIRHLLTMTTGLEWIENGPVVQAWFASEDWVRFIFSLPMANKPGEVFNYTTAGSHLLSALLTRATKMSTLDFADKYLLRPAGIRIDRWDRDPQGYYFGGAEMYLTARNLGKFGLLYLNGGFAGGRQVVPADWIKVSTSAQITLNGNPPDQGYGYMWWTRKAGGVDIFYASGAEGQFLFCIPELSLVVVTHSSLVNSSDGNRIRRHYFSIFDLLDNYILPSVTR
ncbi:MAG: serine hydrolase [Candidatus Glassbacteria bacterium]